jgi:Domain of unknown function (DUF4926)
MDNINKNDVVVLLVEKPDVGLHRGDVGAVIEIFQSNSNHPSGFMVEFVNERGNVQGQVDITDLNEIVKLRSPSILADLKKDLRIA